MYKYQGAGNDFLIADNRDGHITEQDGVLTAVMEDGTLWSKRIDDLCDRRYGVGADGLMLLEAGQPASCDRPDTEDQIGPTDQTRPDQQTRPTDQATDFHMVYFNSDGSGGMMCGNGGRCMVAFAKDCGVKGQIDAAGLTKYIFTAADGLHNAYVLEDSHEGKVIRLKMKDVKEITKYDSLTGVSTTSKGSFLDTGTRHYVRFVKNIDAYDIVRKGRDIRYNAVELQPIGANVNYVEPGDGILKVRTYEKGVEDETFACGTGIVASVLAAYSEGIAPHQTDKDNRLRYFVRARRDDLSVEFLPAENALATSIHLTGPAVKVCEISL